MQIKEGLDYYPELLATEQLAAIEKDIKLALKQAPLFTPTMPKTGKEFSVLMSNIGKLGWVSDQQNGYRYQEFHPITKKPWPEISKNILQIWHEVTGLADEPDCCLINIYQQNAKMGLHVDNDEQDFSYPVLSISLGNTGLFRFGGLKRDDPTKSIKLAHGDVLKLAGKSRLIYHGIDRIYPSQNFQQRINLTMRKV